MEPRLQIRADSRDTAMRYQRMLRSEGLEAQIDNPPAIDCDVAVCVGGATSAESRMPAEANDVGVIAIGTAASADVYLPADCTPRELALACRLLAEVVRLRRNARSRPATPAAAQDLSLIDDLTLAPNRRAWRQELSTRLDAAAQSSLCLAIVDLDHFKQVNTGWGHEAGDRLLVAAAAALRQGVRPGDFVARLGGDEFGLLLSGLPAESAGGVIDRVRRGVPAIAARSAAHVVSCSAGYAVVAPGHRADAESLLAAADAALRRAKKAGRDVAMPADRSPVDWPPR
jgi:diguanylate cyclase (GGDEF)-like protein